LPAVAETPSRILPHNLDAERAVLGAPLAGDPSMLDVAAGLITHRHFFREAHAEIWKAMQALRERNVAIDYLTVCEELTVRDRLEFAGGPAYIGSLTDNLARADNVEHYAQIVRGKALLRDLIVASNRIMAEAYNAEDEPDAILDRAEKAVMGVGSAATKGDFVLAEDWMRETYQLVEKAANDKRIVTGIPSGITKLDHMTRGWQNGDLVYLGARPSSGKTALALQFALEASKHTMTGFISLEMSRGSIGMRAVALEGGLDAFRLMTGFLSEWEQKKAGDAMNDLALRRFAIDDASGSTATQLRAKARRLASRHGLGILFIDYMQLVQDGGESENRNQELSKISWGWKTLARELNIPLIVLSQLSRGSDKENRRPRMSDLRDSGSLEQDADVGLLLWRPQQGESGKFQDGEEAEVIVGKQRNGPIGPVRMQWIGTQMRFGELDEQPAEAKQGSLV